MDTVERLLERLDQSREQLLIAIETLPDEALVEPGAAGRYSVADVLALLTAWESELVTAMMRLDQGKKPDRLLAALARPDAYEEQRYQEYQGRDLDRIFDDWQRVRVQLEEWLEEFSERDLTDPQRYKWLGGRSLAQLIGATTIEKEAAYTPALRAFAEEWAPADGEAPDSFIPLADMFLEHDDDDEE